MAKISWKSTGQKWNLEAATHVGLAQLMKMNTQERAELAQFLRNQFNTRVNSFVRANTVGYAVSKLVEDMADVSGKLNINLDPFEPVVIQRGRRRVLSPVFSDRKNPQNALASYITMMQDFFKAKSSTVKGWKEIGKEQDERIFGLVTKVIPGREFKKKQNIKYVTRLKYEMTDAERIMFWKVYRDIAKTGWTGINDYSSDSQRLFGTKWMSGDFNHLDFEEAYARMVDMLNARPQSLEEHAPGIVGDFFQQEGGFDDDYLTGQ